MNIQEVLNYLTLLPKQDLGRRAEARRPAMKSEELRMTAA
jgi:hypothetical protein